MSQFSFSSAIVLVLVAVSLFIGCAGPQKTTAPEASDQQMEAAARDSTQPVGPALKLLLFDAKGLKVQNLRSSSASLVSADRLLKQQAASPDGRYLALTYVRADSSRLALLELKTQTIQQVHAAPGKVTYSLSWAPESNALAFGFYRSLADGSMGQGDIKIAQLNGRTRSVECRAARKVLKWLPSGQLAVRDKENLYVVTANNCETRSTLDVRKMHHITYSPDGRHMAYIFRDLVYDRENVQYVPDSTLYIANTRGGEKEKVVGDKYRARHLRWSPDGSKLAFDMRSKKNLSRRQIIIYDTHEERLTYLVPPAVAGSDDEVKPLWSPNGKLVAYTLVGEGRQRPAVRTVKQTQMLGGKALLGWAGNKHLVVAASGEKEQIRNLQGKSLHTLSDNEKLLYAW